MKYDLFFQNNGSKQIYEILGVKEAGCSPYYIEFVNLDMPEDMQDGEYTYFVFANSRDDVTYEFNEILGKSVAVVDGKKYSFMDLKPLMGIMRYGDPSSDNKYIYAEQDKNKDNKGWLYQK